MIGSVYVPYIAVKLGEQDVDTVMFDFGAGGFYDISEKSYERLHMTGAFQTLSKGRGILSLGASGLESSTLEYRVEVPTFYLATLSIKSHVKKLYIKEKL